MEGAATLKSLHVEDRWIVSPEVKLASIQYIEVDKNMN